jgi:hypothetical protein
MFMEEGATTRRTRSTRRYDGDGKTKEAAPRGDARRRRRRTATSIVQYDFASRPPPRPGGRSIQRTGVGSTVKVRTDNIAHYHHGLIIFFCVLSSLGSWFKISLTPTTCGPEFSLQVEYSSLNSFLLLHSIILVSLADKHSGLV